MPVNPLYVSVAMNIELMELPIAFMNEDHAEAKALWQEMAAALADYPARHEPLSAACRAFLEHSRAHFAREEDAMQSQGFPPYSVHKAEHDRVLAMLEELVAAVASGAPAETVQHAIMHEIPNWLVLHVQSMDLVTARWLAARG